MSACRDKIRIGLVGLGNFGEKYARLIYDSPRMELSAACSRNEERLKEIAAQYGIGNIYKDYMELSQSKEIDAVCVITEVNRHAEITLNALENGKHVFVEKPLSVNPDDHDMVIKLAEEKGLTVLVGYTNRYIPNIIDIKNMLDKGEMGQLVSIASRRNGISSYLSLPRFSGNAPELIIEPGIHTSDLFLWLSGSRVTRVYAESRNVLGLSFADTWMVVLKMENGVIGTMEQVFHIPPGAPVVMDHRIEVIGTSSIVDYIDPGSDYSVWGQKNTTYLSPYRATNINGKLTMHIRDELDDFALSIMEGRKPLGAGPRECRAAVKVAEAIVRSAKSSKVVYLND